MPESRFYAWVAEQYDALWPELFDPTVVEQTVEFLARWAGPGPALEFGIGTGRIAIPLSRRSIRVHGIELSLAMVGQLPVHDPGTKVGVTVGDFATVTVDEQFTLVYLLRNTITDLTSQDEQVEAFRNAARHLHPGGHFVVENYVPALQRLPPGETRQVFTATPTHLGFEEYDVANQIAISHHYWVIDDQLQQFSSPHRYVWPGELDLMARMAGLTLRQRWASWTREPFTSERRSHISVWERSPF
jgi:SAM-dependent methyltransferase